MLDYLHVHRPWTWKKDKVQVPQRNEMLSLYCAAFGFISKNKEHNPEWNIPNGRYLKNLILQKVIKQYNIIKLNAVIINFYFQCARMTMNNILNSTAQKMKNIIPNKIYLTLGIWKTWYYKKLLSNRN